MGFNKPTWTPGHERSPLSATRAREIAKLRERREHRDREKVAARELEGSLVSLAALLGTPVQDPGGRAVGAVRDVIVNWTAAASYPRMTAIVMRTGKQDVMVSARWVEIAPPASVRLHSAEAYARSVQRRSGDVALAADVLDHQVVDSAGTQVVRPADVYLATVHDHIELVGIEVGPRALLRRLGPTRLRARIRPERVIDWGSIEGFVPRPGEPEPGRGRRSTLAGRPGAGIGLKGPAADIKPVGPSEVQDALRKADDPSSGDAP
jgi:sporulation protein YlmC with PRC-barrel domain